MLKEREAADYLERIAELERSLAESRKATAAPPPGSDRLPAAARDSDDVVETDDRRVLQEVGIYQYRHRLDDAVQYRERLSDIQAAVKGQVKRGTAITASDMFSFNNSLAKGRKMTSEFSKLMLRAYNAEADICVRTIRAGNLETAVRRLEKAAAAISKLGTMMEMRVSDDYHQLRVEELELTSDYLVKVQQEREDQRAEKERLREERRVEQELAAQRERLDKEYAHYMNVLNSLGDDANDRQRILDKLSEIGSAIDENDYRQANIRAGYVYVISNRGAFGPGVVKIGMTWRLDPMDRVRELGSASVPFPFDVHALYFSDDAVTLETHLHEAFAARRLNHANLRREFFFASPAEVRQVLVAEVGNLLEYMEEPEASQYFQSVGRWPTSTQ
ncbi:chromosome segregation ATPase [Tsukamurella pulmonis]|nr:chromosome segregation ATPase [Tsukamurella pulmonis]